MKRPDRNSYNRETIAATAWLILFAMLVAGAVYQRLGAPISVEVSQTSGERASTLK
jgi:hypothetical protein